MSNAAYRELYDRFRRLSLLADAAAILHWDNAAMMPSGGAGARAEQLANLSEVRHTLLCAPDMGELMAAAETGDDPWHAANLREMQRKWRHATALESRLVAALSRAGSACEQTWRRARAADDFESLRPKLETVVELVREKAAAKAAALDLAPYDALLDEYEPGLTGAAIEPLFEPLAAALPSLADRAIERQGPPPEEQPVRVPVAAQARFAEQIMTVLGFDFRHGRLDTSHHPFTGGVADDVRLTTRYDEGDPLSGLMAVMHETGHALYERALPPEWRNQPVGAAMGMAVHESQSLSIEMQLGRSDDFLSWLAPQLPGAWGVDGGDWGAAGLARRLRRVERSLIRVDADEVTYPLHIMLRYRLEQDLISGDLSVADLPEAWRQGMARTVGARPDDDRDGVMQDIHWMDGAFGYFPTYTLGAMAAAQLCAAAARALPGLAGAIRGGDVAPLTGWLRDNVHRQASLHARLDDLLIEVTGAPLRADDFLAHLAVRYGGDAPDC
jgi:carboxypeptidase Taq